MTAEPIFGAGWDELVAEQDQQAADLAWAQAAHVAQFERARFRSPYRTGGGTEKGEWVKGWVCPSCGDVEWNEYGLSLNHGWEPHPSAVSHPYLAGPPLQWHEDWTLCRKQLHSARRVTMPGDPEGGYTEEGEGRYLSPTPGRYVKRG